MPVRVIYNNTDICTLRPSPVYTISTNIQKDGAGKAYGVTYSITLQGTLISDRGTPYARDEGYELTGKIRFEPALSRGQEVSSFVGPYGAFDNTVSHHKDAPYEGRPPIQFVNSEAEYQAIQFKQKALRALFYRDGQRLEISDWADDAASIICYPRVTSIDFEDDTYYIGRCKYTITLEADTILDQYNKVDHEGLHATFLNIKSTEGIEVSGTSRFADAYDLELPVYEDQNQRKTETELINQYNALFLQQCSESWSIEVDEQQSEKVSAYEPYYFLPRTYRVTHNLSATGKTHYGPDGEQKAWEQAKKYVQAKQVDDPFTGLSGNYGNIPNSIGSGCLNLIEQYQGYNHVRTEQYSEHDGTYSCTETWIVASGRALETFNLNITSSIDAPFINVNLDGQIKGLSQITPSGYGLEQTTQNPYQANNPLSQFTAYHSALEKYNEITNSGNFGLSCDVFKRVNNAVAVQLNSQPKSITIGSNQQTGDLNYSLQFDNRPTNIISGVLNEQITVNDTYPGDVFATIPVIGRQTGPVLQYMGNRTEYKRDVSINLTLDYTKVPYGKKRNPLLLKKPSIVQPMAGQLHELLTELSPSNEPGIRKYFCSPPSETWNPKNGQYSFNISWTYELDT